MFRKLDCFRNQNFIYYTLMHKVCTSCKCKLPVSDFNWKIKNVRLNTWCKECTRKHIRDHYRRNRDYYLNKARKRNAILRKKGYEYIADYLIQHPCVDCGESDILVLEFDHINRNSKYGNVGTLIRAAGSFQKIIEEISKCEVRCANCHRRKTERENRSWKLKYAPVA